jgi:hypothetical protein
MVVLWALLVVQAVNLFFTISGDAALWLIVLSAFCTGTNAAYVLCAYAVRRLT